MYQRNVLIVEDEPLIRMMLADALIDEGYSVLEAGNAIEAIAWFAHTVIDAVITDIDMPGGLNGLELAQTLSRTHPSTVLIVASGGQLLGPKQLPDGARFVSKPYSLQGMTAMVKAMIETEICGDARDHTPRAA